MGYWFNFPLSSPTGSEITDWLKPVGPGPQMLAADLAQGLASNYPTDAWSILPDSDDFQIPDGDMVKKDLFPCL
jgi:hypothetical protein